MKIITLTLSPALDVTYALAGEVKRGLNRALSHSLTSGGKGINVARAIMREAELLGRAAQVSALYPSGGVTGDLLSSALAMEGISTIAVKTAENCRINVSAISSDSEDIEINARGAAINEVELSKIESELDVLTEGDVLAICGSVPAGVEKSYYARLIRKMKDRGVICVLDCDGEALQIAVCGDCPPDYVKPNESEIAEFCESIGADVSAEAIVTASGGRCAVITFHSLEDRIVKTIFKELTTAPFVEPRLPVKASQMEQASFTPVTRKPVTAGDEELARNRRAHSAKLRAVERIR